MADSEPDARAAPQQARSQRTLRRLLQAANDVLADGGVDGFAIATVADRADVSVGSIYRYFRSKDDLLEAVALHAVDDIQSAVTQHLHGDIPTLLDVFARYSHALAQVYRAKAGVVVSLLTISNPRVQTRSAETLQAIGDRLTDAASPHLANPNAASQAIRFAGETLLAACLVRAAKGIDVDDPDSWATWSQDLAAMATTHVRAHGHDQT